MMLTSVIIPARNEKYLQATLESLYANAGTEIETVVVLDGPTQYPFSRSFPNLMVLENPEPIGIKKSIHRAYRASHGWKILKLDAHCIVGDNFVKTLEEDLKKDDWVMVARRWTLNLETMERKPRIVDYYYLSCPWTNPKVFMMQSCPWISRTEQRMDIPIDDLMCFQGSMWMMSRRFLDWLIGGLWDREDMQFAEHHWLSMKTWSGGGRVVIDKNTWYAHPKVVTGGYRMDMGRVFQDHTQSAQYWTGQVKFFAGLIQRFWPLPTERNHHRIEKYVWPEDWGGFYANP